MGYVSLCCFIAMEKQLNSEHGIVSFTYWFWRSLHGFLLVPKSDRNKYPNCSFKKMGTERKITTELCLLKLTPLMHRLLEMDNNWLKSW